jgi:inosine-uridine nucleoside N-ribohydrolase
VKVLLDTDIGGDFDDANALALLARSPEIELVAVTTVGAGASARRRAEVARHLLRAAGRPEVPVFAGLDEPRVRNPLLDDLSPEHCLNAWSEELSAGPPDAPSATDAIVEMARRHGPDLTILSIGAMTNVADALRRDPAALADVGGIVAMSGAFTSQLREANVVIDPEAADDVYRSGLPLKLVGFEEASKPSLELGEYAAVPGSPLAGLLASMAERYGEVYGTERVTLCDVTAVSVVLRPHWFRFREATVAVELDGRHARGITVVETDPYLNRVPGGTRVDIAVESSPERVLELFRSRVLPGASTVR